MSENRFLKRMESRPETRALLELYVGIIIFSVLFLFVGVIFINPRIFYCFGVLLGAVGAAFQAYGIYDTLDRALSEDKGSAQKFAMIKSIVRLLINLVLMVISIIISSAMFFGVVLGLFSLKLSGVFNTTIKKYLFKHHVLPAGGIDTEDFQENKDMARSFVEEDDENMSEPEYHKKDLL